MMIELSDLASKRLVVWEKALKASTDVAQTMVKREVKRQPSSLYYTGESVLVRIPVTKKSVSACNKEICG